MSPGKKYKNGTIENVTCLEIVIVYNSDMGGVDKNDQMKSYCPISVASKKRWVRIFYDILQEKESRKTITGAIAKEIYREPFPCIVTME